MIKNCVDKIIKIKQKTNARCSKDGRLIKVFGLDVMIPARHSLAVSAQTKLKNVDDFIVLLIKELETECCWKRNRILF